MKRKPEKRLPRGPVAISHDGATAAEDQQQHYASGDAAAATGQRRPRDLRPVSHQQYPADAAKYNIYILYIGIDCQVEKSEFMRADEKVYKLNLQFRCDRGCSIFPNRCRSARILINWN